MTRDRQSPPISHPLPPLSALVWCLGTMQVLTWASSLAHQTLTQPLALAVLGASTLAGIAAFIWTRRALAPLELAPSSPALIPRWFLACFVMLALAFVLLAFGIALRRPDVSCDGNYYHIPPMGYWAREGYVHWIRVDSMPKQLERLINGYPKGVELLAFVIARALGTSRLIPAVTFCFLPLGVCGIAQLAHALGARPLLAWAAGLLFPLVPTIVSQSATTYTDASYACCVTALFALALSRRAWTAHPLFWLATLGTSAGLVLSVKGTGLLPVAIVFAYLSVAGTYAAIRRPARRVHAVARGTLALALAAGIALTVGGYWYIRNYAHTGSPLYPVGLRIGSWQVFPGDSMSAVIGTQANTPPWLRRRTALHRIEFVWRQGKDRWPQTILTYDSRDGGLGFLWPLACIPAVVGAAASLLYQRLRGVRASAQGTLALLALFTAANFALTPMNWWPRYTLWLYALGLPALAYVVQHTPRRNSARIALTVWLLACVTLAAWEGGFTLRHVATRADPIRAPLNDPAIQASLAGPDTVALLAPAYEGLLGPLLLPLGSRDVTFIGPYEAAHDGPQVLARLRRQHVRYILHERDLQLAPELRNAVRETIPSGPLDLLDLDPPRLP